jgi:hypothetical protein
MDKFLQRDSKQIKKLKTQFVSRGKVLRVTTSRLLIRKYDWKKYLKGCYESFEQYKNSDFYQVTLDYLKDINSDSFSKIES